MTVFGVSLLERHIKELRDHLFSDGSNERAAYVLFGKANIKKHDWKSGLEHLFVSHSIEHVENNAIISSSPWEISWHTNDVIKKLKLAQKKKLTLGIVHNHSEGFCKFSHVDDDNETELIRTIQNRNGTEENLLSLLFTPDGQWRARLWSSQDNVADAYERRSIGNRFNIEFKTKDDQLTPQFLERQVLALGKGFNQQINQLRVVIVGCGGTGSAVAMLLARIGVGNIALIDKDSVEESNLNRLHGARRADIQKPKVEVLARSIREIDLGTNVITYTSWVSDQRCRDTLKSAHVIFGCTDDHSGRIVLNRFAYAYQIPVIDMGLAVELSKSEPPEVQAMDGRVTVLTPGESCLLCRGVINPRRASEESLKRQNPEQYEQQKAEAYILGEQDPSPAVVTFTTELACMAVNEMIHRIQGFRGNETTANRVRLFHRMTDLRPSRKLDSECRICGQSDNWCRGDTEPFLGIVGL
jgi:molybdopterin/thiamine biosynthesis adenylyltransferase